MSLDNDFEPYLISVVRPIHLTTKEERINVIRQSRYNLFNIPSEKVSFDFLTDSGTGAISNDQLADIIRGDTGHSESKSFFQMKKTITEITGFPHVIPTHQGRGAENVFFSTILKPGNIIPGNTHFNTTKSHIESRQAHVIDCTIKESRNPFIIHPFKGNLDLNLLKDILKNSKNKIPFVIITLTCNNAGGHPVSMENIKQIKVLCHKYGIGLFFDIARFAENAYFIKTKEKGYADKSIQEICKEIFSESNGALMSAKKDAISLMGGFLALKDKDLYDKCLTNSILFEGYITSGGMTKGTMLSIAQGLQESMQFSYLKSRVNQVQYFLDQLKLYNIPLMEPAGGHAVYIDAKRFLPSIPPSKYPAQSLGIAAYIEEGIRGVAMSTMLSDTNSKQKDPHPDLELFRLSIPRRTFTNNHLSHVSKVLGELYKKNKKIKGLKITYNPSTLRHFACEFHPDG